MLREFVQLVSETVDAGFERGIHRFMEGLEEDLTKDEVLAEVGSIDVVLGGLFEEAGVQATSIEDLENIDEAKLDALLKEMEQ